ASRSPSARRPAAAAAWTAAGTPSAARTAFVLAVLHDGFHREASFQAAFLPLRASPRGALRPPTAAASALVGLELLLHALRHQIDDEIVLADLGCALHRFLAGEDADEADAIGPGADRLERFAEPRQAISGRAGRLGDRLVERGLRCLGLRLFHRPRRGLLRPGSRRRVDRLLRRSVLRLACEVFSRD